MWRRIPRATQCSNASMFATSALLRGLEQVEDVPTSTSRKPTGLHRGPGRRQTSPKEAGEYQFIKKWDLQMKEQWDDLEPFKGIPKPKKQFGNEATEIIWPYTLLMERLIKVHPFTKSIYVYYPQHALSPQGAAAMETAKQFSRRSLIPLTFHNSQCYVETEMLLEHSDTPWIVVHCLDGRSEILPIRVAADAVDNITASEDNLLRDVVQIASKLGSSVVDPVACTRMLHERPLQNQYLRINYQWYGDTPEERMAHLVKWDFETQDVMPKVERRAKAVLDWMSFDGNLPNHQSVKMNVAREGKRLQTGKSSGGVKSFFNSAGSRSNARHSRFGGTSGTNS